MGSTATAIKQAAAATEAEVTPYVDLTEQVERFTTASAAATEASAVIEAAQVTLSRTRVVRAKAIYLIATHPDVQNNQTRKAGVNLKGALRAIGLNPKNSPTYAPLLHVGKVLADAGMVYESETTEESIKLAADAIDAYDNSVQRAKRLEAKAKAAADKQELEDLRIARELEGKDSEGNDVPAPAPAAAPPTPTAPSVQSNEQSVPTPGETATRQAVEDKGTLSVTEEPALEPRGEDEVEVFLPGRGMALIEETLRHFAGMDATGVNLSDLQREVVESALAEISALISPLTKG